MGRRRSIWTIELAKELVRILKLRNGSETPIIYREVKRRVEGRFMNGKINYNKVYRTLMALYNAGFVDRRSVNGRVAWYLKDINVKPEDVARALLSGL